MNDMDEMNMRTIDCDDSVMLIGLTGYCMAESDFDHMHHLNISIYIHLF